MEATAKIAKYGKVERIAATLTVEGAAIPPINTKSAVAIRALAASGSSVRSLFNPGTRRRIEFCSAIVSTRPHFPTAPANLAAKVQQANGSVKPLRNQRT